MDLSKVETNHIGVKIISLLRYNGYESYFVGGCVRDILLKRTPKDWDITTNAKPSQVIQIFKELEWNVIETGLKHGTVTVSYNNIEFFEVTTYRTDGQYSDGRRPDSVTFVNSLTEDLARRDFTINAMAFDPIKGKIIDRFSGMEDIKNKVVRCVGHAQDRFSEDYLRMLRAVRFACQLGFRLEYSIIVNIKNYREEIVNVSTERVREELFKMLTANPRLALELLRKTELMKVIVPEFWGAYSMKHDNPHHQYNLWEHTAVAMSSEYIEKRTDLTVALFLHDIGKLQTKVCDEKGIAHYYGHANESKNIAESILTRLKVSNEFKNKVITLIGAHEDRAQGKKGVKRQLMLIGEDNLRDLFRVQLADASAHQYKCFIKSMNEIKQNIAYLEEIITDNECIKVTDLKINGKDLINLGCKEGKMIGTILNELFNTVLENTELNNRDYLIEKANTLLKNGGIIK